MKTEDCGIMRHTISILRGQQRCAGYRQEKCWRLPKRGRSCVSQVASPLYIETMFDTRQAARGSPPGGAFLTHRRARRSRPFFLAIPGTPLLSAQVAEVRCVNLQSHACSCFAHGSGSVRAPRAVVRAMRRTFRENDGACLHGRIHGGECRRVPKRGRCRASSRSSPSRGDPMYDARQAARGSPPCGAVPLRRMAKRTRPFPALNVPVQARGTALTRYDA